jgi:heme exporter protein C
MLKCRTIFEVMIMLKYLYALGAPKTFYKFSRKILPFLGLMALVSLAIGWGWGLFFSPADYQQGDAVRIMYIHVPAAFLSLSIYAFMAICAAVTLIWRIKIASLLLRSAAFVGAMMTLLALLTGSFWGKPTWGAWWVWDARLTGELILLFIYAGLLSLSHVLGQQQASDKIVAIICWIGALDLPIIHYSVKWWNTLHQGSSLMLAAKPKIHLSMLYPLLFSLLGLFCFCYWAIFSLTQYALLKREYRQKWVSELELLR